MPYIHFTEEQKRLAASVDLVDFLRHRGEKLLPSGHEKRLDSDHSITVRGNEWYDHEAEKGGGPISFAQTFYHLSYPDAVTLLLDGLSAGACSPAGKQDEVEKKQFQLPPANYTMRRVYAYLMKKRRIDWEVITAFVRAGLLYEDAKYHNAVFVGLDEHGVARHAHKRSTNSSGKAFRQNVEGGDPRYSFRWLGGDDSLYVFEAPIDLLSYITLYPDGWGRHNYVACCGVSPLPVMEALRRMDQPRQVFLCLDNDAAGQAANQRMAEQIQSQFGIAADILIPVAKDWNEELCAMSETPKFSMSTGRR